MVGLFNHPNPSQSPTKSPAKQLTFLKLKAITVPLLETSRSPISSTSTTTILNLLENLRNVIDNVPELTPALANYAFFPLTSLLQPRPDGQQRGDRVLESTMQALNCLVKQWQRVGMEGRVRNELWIMTILTLGGPLAGKGKEVDRTEECKLAMVEVLETLMKTEAPIRDQDPMGERLDWTGTGSLPTETSTIPAPPTSILFHTLQTLLPLASEPTSLVELQTSSISALRVLITSYLAVDGTPPPLLATALPGTASTLSRIALSKPPKSTKFGATSRKQSTLVIVAALDLLAEMVTRIVGDSVTMKLREDDESSRIVILDELAGQRYNFEPSDSTNLPDSEEPASSTDTPPRGPTIPTRAWLRFTISSLSTLFAALSPLTSHHSPRVRTAFVDLLSRTIETCRATFGTDLEGIVEGLLTLAGDDWDTVRNPARQSLVSSFSIDSSLPTSSSSSTSTIDLVGQIVRRRLASLPLAMRKEDEDSARRSARVVRVALDNLSTLNSDGGALDGIERWSWPLVSAIELERVSNASIGSREGMRVAWVNGTRSEVEESLPTFARMRLRKVQDESTVDELERLWKALGEAAGRSQQEASIFDHFVGIALGPRRYESVATTSLWILDGALGGLKGLKVDKRRKKVVKGLVKSVLQLLEELELEGRSSSSEEEEEEVAEEEEKPSNSTQTLEISSEGTDSPVAVQHSKGVTAIPSLDRYRPVVARITPQEDRASHRLHLVSLLMRLLASAATFLESSFQPFLMQSLYHVLAHLSPTTHPHLRSTARTALSLIADATAYASPQNLVLANVDYVVNSVSQRLSVTHLDPSAPLVLVEMIRLVGRPIVPIVQDLVDDVFEALDDYHGYEELTIGLWAVLDALLKAMEEDLPVERTASTEARKKEDSSFDTFREWFEKRKEAKSMEEDEPEEINPQRPFETGFTDNRDAEDGPTEFPETKETPPTRPQLVTAQILSKSLYFLSHPSPFLRARVLSLLASAVPLLARPSFDAKSQENRAADLLPVIHRAWPYILARFSDTEPYVVVEAAGLIESLASHVGDFMSRRILDDIWPRFRSLLVKQEIEDRSSPLASSTRYSTSHRLHRSILKTLLDVAISVPLKEDIIWDQAVLLRRFLSVSVDPELQAIAIKLYEALGQVNADAVWLVLAGTVELSSDLPLYLRMTKTDFGGNVDRILSQL